MKVKIGDLKIREEVYPRNKTSWLTVYQYAEAMKMGDKFPEIFVAKVGDELFVVDGVHRVLACKQAKIDEVDAVVREYKSEKEMFMDAVEKNIAHGRQLSVQDKVKIVNKLKEFGIKKEKISEITKIPVNKVDKFLARTIKGPKGEPIYLKGSVARETVDKGSTPSSDVEQDLLSSPNILHMINQLIEFLGIGITLDDKTKEKLAELRHKIDEALR